jgi:hypothetical protein
MTLRRSSSFSALLAAWTVVSNARAMKSIDRRRPYCLSKSIILPCMLALRPASRNFKKNSLHSDLQEVWPQNVCTRARECCLAGGIGAFISNDDQPLQTLAGHVPLIYPYPQPSAWAFPSAVSQTSIFSARFHVKSKTCSRASSLVLI